MKGHSLIEVLVAVTVVSTLAAISVPRVLGTIDATQLSAAAIAVKTSIQAARFQAVMKGYPHQLTFTSSTRSYQLATKPAGAGSFASVGNAVSFTGMKTVTLNQTTTLQFTPGGVVSATAGAMSMTLTYKTYSRTIGVSANGDVTITTPVARAASRSWR